MRDLPILMDVMPPCLCESKVIGYEYNEDGFNITHCDSAITYYKMDRHGREWGVWKGVWCVCVGCNTMRMPASIRSLSDIERIIELEERLNNSEPKKEECKHLSSTASYTHVTCDSCYMIRTDGGWGCASRKWFDNIESAKFYEKNGFLPR